MKAEITVPIVVEIEFDEPMCPNEDNGEPGMKQVHEWAQSPTPKREFVRAVREMVGNESVRVKDVYAASKWTLGLEDTHI